MGTAGMGDCLSGVLTSFITMLQSGIDYRAILYAIALHSYSADLLSSGNEAVGILATDVIEGMKKIINENNDKPKEKIKEKIKLPILCKDFFVDKFQVPLAKSYGADAILIIMAGVSETLANELYEEAIKLNMTVIVEVHTVEEAKKALKFKSALIGINNRNLKTLKTDINTTFDIHDVLKNHTGPLISESGIKTKEELLELSNKTTIKTFLIGESLLKNLDNNSIFSVL